MFNPAAFNTFHLNKDAETANINITNVVVGCNSFHITDLQLALDQGKNLANFSDGRADFGFTANYSDATLGIGTLDGNFHFDDIFLARRFEIDTKDTFSSVNYSVSLLNMSIHTFNVTKTGLDPKIKANAEAALNTEAYKNAVATILIQEYLNLFSNYYAKQAPVKQLDYTYKGKTISYNLNTKSYFYNQSSDFSYKTYEVIGLTGGAKDDLPANLSISVDNFFKPINYFSKSVLQNSLSYAVLNKMLDNNIDETWGYKTFGFFIGDLALSIPAIRKDYYPDDKVNGVCSVLNLNSFTFSKADNISAVFKCSCQINAVKDAKKLVTLTFDVSMSAIPVWSNDIITISIIKSELSGTPTLVPEDIYKEQFKQKILENLLKDGIKSLIGKTAFGTGFPVEIRPKNPMANIENDYLMLYQQKC